jgi:beta-glucosidase
VSDEYAKPAGTSLFVTENGAAYDDEPVIEDGVTRVHDAERVDFVRDHLGAILDAVDAGVDVRGYFYWSLLDNFEWAWGYEKRFGIVRVDYETQERSVKDSGREYARIIAARELDDTGLDTGGVDDTDRNITAATDATGS